MGSISDRETLMNDTYRITITVDGGGQSSQGGLSFDEATAQRHNTERRLVNMGYTFDLSAETWRDGDSFQHISIVNERTGLGQTFQDWLDSLDGDTYADQHPDDYATDFGQTALPIGRGTRI